MTRTFALAVAALFVFAGCSSTFPAHQSASNVLESQTDRQIINNIPLNYRVSIVQYHSRITNGLQEIQVDLQNHRQQQYDLEYKIDWLDADGYVIESTPWQPLTINAKEYRSIKAIAHSPQAEDFKFYIRAKQ